MEKTKGYCAEHLAFVGVARRRRLHAKGSVFAFAPTSALRGTSLTESSGAEDVARWWKDAHVSLCFDE
jgi:translation elongation factor EF-1alpha